MGIYHDTLGVQDGASESDIKKAFRKRSKECHPDLHPNDPEKAEEFRKITEARDGLLAGQSGPNNSGRTYEYAHQRYREAASGSFSDIFKHMNDHFEEMHRKQREASDRPMNVQMVWKVPIGMFFSGGSFQIEGNIPTRDKYGQLVYEPFEKTITVKPDTKVGEILRFPNEGVADSKGVRGDLFILLEPAQDGPFEPIDEINIFSRTTINVFDAILGTNISVKLHDGKNVDITIPENTKNGQIIRLKQRGMRHQNGTVGDFLLEITLNQPVLSDKQKDILREAVEKINGS